MTPSSFAAIRVRWSGLKRFLSRAVSCEKECEVIKDQFAQAVVRLLSDAFVEISRKIWDPVQLQNEVCNHWSFKYCASRTRMFRYRWKRCVKTLLLAPKHSDPTKTGACQRSHSLPAARSSSPVMVFLHEMHSISSAPSPESGESRSGRSYRMIALQNVRKCYSFNVSE